ncbi:MAG: hypothetical protein IKZ98_13880 [Clostridia bacterium]|nr:hypothetical protein [Clostridia bacterium]
MKRALTLVCILIMTLCLMTSAQAAAPKGGYVLLESMKNVPAAAADISLPEGLAQPARVTEFSVENGIVKLALDKTVSCLQINELNFMEGAEKVIFSQEGVSFAEAEKTGDENSVFIVYIYPDEQQKRHFVEEYNTWTGDLAFVRSELTLRADVSMFPSWNSGQNTYSFREDGTLISETRTLSSKNAGFTRTVTFAPDGRTESCLVGWRSAEYSGYELNVELDGKGVPLSLNYRADDEAFMVRSLPLNADAGEFEVLLNNCFDPTDATTTIVSDYPPAAAAILRMATMTDLPPVGDGASGNARVWVLTFGDYSEFEEYVFVAEDPLFLLQDRKVVPNTDAKDINGSPVDFASMPSAETPEFDVPVFKQ